MGNNLHLIQHYAAVLSMAKTRKLTVLDRQFAELELTLLLLCRTDGYESGRTGIGQLITLGDQLIGFGITKTNWIHLGSMAAISKNNNPKYN